MPVWPSNRVVTTALPGGKTIRILICTLVGILVLAVEPGSAVRAQTSDLVSRTALRICADPANLPMSNDKGQGYENTLAELFAAKLAVPVEYFWFPMATGFVRKTLQENRCDVIIGYAQGQELVLNTNHYLVSSYVLVVPRDSALSGVDRLDDSRLVGKRLGIVAGTPPATHMTRNGLMQMAKPYHLTVDRRVDSPAEDMLADVQSGELAGGILWGPIAGPLVKQSYPGLVVIPLLHETLPPRLIYRITMGVRQGELTWKHKLNSLIRRHQGDIDRILRDAGVPLLNDLGTALKDGGS